MRRKLNLNLSGDEVYYTNSLILLVKNMLCSKLDCQKALIELSFHLKSQRVLAHTPNPHPSSLYTESQDPISDTRTERAAGLYIKFKEFRCNILRTLIQQGGREAGREGGGGEERGEGREGGRGGA